LSSSIVCSDCEKFVKLISNFFELAIPASHKFSCTDEECVEAKRRRKELEGEMVQEGRKKEAEAMKQLLVPVILNKSRMKF